MNVIGFLVVEWATGDLHGVQETGPLVHRTAVARMPWTWPADVLLTVIEWDAEDVGAHVIALRIRAPDGSAGEPLELSPVLVVPSPDERPATTALLSNLRGLPLPAFGVYAMELLIDDRIAGQRRFQFVPIVAGEPTRALRIVRE